MLTRKRKRERQPKPPLGPLLELRLEPLLELILKPRVGSLSEPPLELTLEPGLGLLLRLLPEPQPYPCRHRHIRWKAQIKRSRPHLAVCSKRHRRICLHRNRRPHPTHTLSHRRSNPSRYITRSIKSLRALSLDELSPCTATD